MKKFLSLMLIAILFIGVNACKDDDDPVTPTLTYKISGTVEAPDGSGLAGATVALAGASTATATSDANGEYEFTALETGDYTVTVTSSEYDFETTTITITALAKDEVADFSAVEAYWGTWLSADANVAPLLAGAPFNYDSVRVVIKKDMTVSTSSHVKDGAWTTITGVYTVTKSATGTIHKVGFNYTAFEQEGIFQVTKGTPDQFKLEALQTVPAIGFTPRTPETGFGSDPALGTANIQNYVRVN